MFLVLMLLNNFQQAESANTALANAIANRLNIVVFSPTLEPTTGCDRLKIGFQVKNEIEHLSGQFTVSHRGKECGSVIKGPTLSQNQKITISCSLSPCNSYEDMEIKAHFKDNREPMKIRTQWGAKPFGNCCPHLATTTPPPPTTATTTTTMTPEDESPNPAGTNTASTSLTTGIIVASVLVMVLTVIVAVAILLKKKRDEKLERGNVMKTEENNLYGIYAEGPVYNVVSDENDYYGS